MRISQVEALKMLEEDRDIRLVDVRSYDEFERGHIPGAICIPYAALDTRLEEIFPEKTDKIMLYCQSGKKCMAIGNKLEKLGYALANWNRTQAQTKMSQMLSQYGSKIELVLANNDDMALGAIDAYKEAEIPQSRWPVIVGIDGTSTGLAAVRAGEMTATVYNDQRGQASAMFALAEALGSGKNLDTFDLIDGKNEPAKGA